MSRKLLLLALSMVSSLFFFFASPARAAEPSPTPAGDAGLPGGMVFDTNYYRKDKEQYEMALQDCGTPSLECLVHYTSTYTAIEWLDRIIGVKQTGPAPAPSGNENKTPGLIKDGQPQAAAPRNNGSFVGGMSYLIGQMYEHPVAQTSTFVADVMESARLAPPAYAQGLGFTALNPILDLWKIFRNLAYIFFVMILIIIGFMIMLRKKIGSAAITAQQAIPSIVISLIFVTFSYAIAGFLIDMMYLSMFLIVGVFESTAGFQDNIINFNIIQLMVKLFQGTANLELTSDIVETFLAGLTDSTAGSQLIGFLGGLTLSLVLAIAILIGTFKLFFELLQAYARVVLHVVTAPMFLMVGAIPGKNVFADWIRKIVGNLIPFPTVLLVVVMFYFFTQNVGQSEAAGGFMPPFLLGRGQASTISALMGLAIILALPDIVKHFREEIAGKGGIGEMIYGWAQQNVKQGVPLSSRIAGVTAGAGLGAAGGVISNIPEAIRTRNVGQLFTNVGKSAGAGARLGAEAAGWVSRSMGANQPDILNPVTNYIDRRFATERSRRTQALIQLGEDIAQTSGLGPRATLTSQQGSSGSKP